MKLDETLILKENEMIEGKSRLYAADSHANDSEPQESNGRAGRATLSQLISGARDSAEHAREAEEKVRKLQYAALSQSYDLALWAANNPEELAIQLIFGADCEESQLENFTAILLQARSCNVEEGEMMEYLKDLDRGMAPLVG